MSSRECVQTCRPRLPKAPCWYTCNVPFLLALDLFLCIIIYDTYQPLRAVNALSLIVNNNASDSVLCFRWNLKFMVSKLYWYSSPVTYFCISRQDSQWWCIIMSIEDHDYDMLLVLKTWKQRAVWKLWVYDYFYLPPIVFHTL